MADSTWNSLYARMIKMRMKFMSCILVQSLCLQVG